VCSDKALRLPGKASGAGVGALLRETNMERVPEPEIMSAEEEATVYELADFSKVNQAFAKRVMELVPPSPGKLIDLGCGPGDILLRIFRLAPRLSLFGLDGARAMIVLAQKQMEKERVGAAIHFLLGDAKGLAFAPGCLDVVISNSLVHHLPDPGPFWREIRRVAQPGAAILIQDLSRPDTPEAARRIVERESGSEPQLLKDLFFYSLRASFTPEEVRGQLVEAGLEGLRVRMSSDRHWEVAGRLAK
jgi:ubiquinone/menaquinone biosynthesis C-methylase UbiE